MKKTIFLLLMALITGFTACKEEETPIADNSDFQAVKNDESWTSTTTWANYSQEENTFYLNAAKYDARYYSDEQLSISFELQDFTKPTTITKFSSRLYSIIGGEGQTRAYNMDASANNHIQITSVDPTRKTISGSFKIKLVANDIQNETGKSVQYVVGRFSIEYNEIE